MNSQQIIKRLNHTKYKFWSPCHLHPPPPLPVFKDNNACDMNNTPINLSNYALIFPYKNIFWSWNSFLIEIELIELQQMRYYQSYGEIGSIKTTLGGGCIYPMLMSFRYPTSQSCTKDNNIILLLTIKCQKLTDPSMELARKYWSQWWSDVKLHFQKQTSLAFWRTDTWSKTSE